MGKVLLNLYSYFHLIQHYYLIPFYKKYKLTPLQIQILDILRLYGNLTITHSELSRLLVVSRPTLVESLKKLEHKNLIAKGKGTQGRLIVIRISEQAQKEIDEQLKPLEQTLMKYDALSTLYPLLLESAAKVDESIPNPQLRTCLNCLFYKEEEKIRGFCRYLKKSLSIYQYPLQCPYFTSLKDLRSKLEQAPSPHLERIKKQEKDKKLPKSNS